MVYTFTVYHRKLLSPAAFQSVNKHIYYTIYSVHETKNKRCLYYSHTNYCGAA